jgi:ubiquinone/menaquinone biosynthesis C-methylase UbiE
VSNFEAFKRAEIEGWQRVQGDEYYDTTNVLTLRAIPHLLDLARVGAGSKVMVLACGPGYGVAEAAQRGAEPVGVDIAESMLGTARRLFPAHRFERGDAESLRYPDESFDSVLCPSGVLHFAYPEKAFPEIRRVLKPNGRFAFSVWATPDRNPYFGLILGAVAKHGRLDVPLPQGPDMFAFSNHAESAKALEATGFTNVEVRDVEVIVTANAIAPDFLVKTVTSTTVRTRLLLDAQTEAAREAIFGELRAAQTKLQRPDGGFELPFCMVFVGGQKA